MRNEKIITLKLTAAVVIDGQIIRAGTLVEMVEHEAKDLLRRGRAALATEHDDDADGAAADATADATADASAAQAALAATVDAGAEAAKPNARKAK